MRKELIDLVVKKVMEDLEQEKKVAPKGSGLGIFDSMNDAIEAAYVAQKELYGFSVDKRNEFANAIRAAVLDKQVLHELSRDAVDETGIGRYEDKLLKNEIAVKKTPGKEILETRAMTGQDGLTIEEFSPFGVIGSITPTTNPTETMICNSLSMIIGGNSVVFSPHPRAKKVSIKLTEIINRALIEAGAPANLVTMVREPSIENTNIMMNHPKIRLLVATGGPAIVKSVLSSGKKAIGAGAGNPPVVVDETADIKQAAKDIIAGCGFDNNVPCIAEKEVFAVDKIFNQLIFHMKQAGAYELDSMELVDELDKIVSTPEGKPKPDFVGKSAQFLLSKIGIEVDDSVRVIIFRAKKDHHLVQEEMMMPILPIVSVCDVDTAIEWAKEAEHGNRHTAIMHSKNIDKLTKMARELETTIFVKNAPSYAGIGVGGEGWTTFTIAGPTGEGITNARTFCRIRRCVMKESFNIR